MSHSNEPLDAIGLDPNPVDGPALAAYARYDADPRVNGPDDYEAFRDAIKGLFDVLKPVADAVPPDRRSVPDDFIPEELRSHPTREWDFYPDTGDIVMVDDSIGATCATFPGAGGQWATLVSFEDGTLGIGVIIEDEDAPQGGRSYAVLLQPAEAKRAREFLRSDS